MRRFVRRIAPVVLGLAALGCGASTTARLELVPTLVAAPVADEQFADELLAVLTEPSPDTSEAASRRVRVARAQLRRAGARFARGEDALGLEASLGALLLLRRSDALASLVESSTTDVLFAVAAELSRMGDEGRARAVFEALRDAGSSRASDAASHLAAMDRFAEPTGRATPIVRLGEEQASSARRALLDPRAVEGAVQAASVWIDEAIEHNLAFRQTGKRPTPDQATEVARALEVGALTVVALHLRYGDLDAGLEALEGSSARRVIEPDAFAELVRLSSVEGPNGLLEAGARLEAWTASAAGSDLGMDAALLAATQFGLRAEAFRRAPKELGAALRLADSLVAFGFADAVPTMLGPLAEVAHSPVARGAWLERMWSSLAWCAEHGRLEDAARGARTILPWMGAIAGHRDDAIAAMADELRRRLAAIAVRAGRLETAEAAVRERASAAEVLLRARIARQRGELDVALAQAAAAEAAPDASPLTTSDARLVAFAVHRARGETARAAESLDAALASSLRAALDPPSTNEPRQARALLRLLTWYDDPALRLRAAEHAFECARGRPAEVGAALLVATSVAVAADDPELARHALARGRLDGAPREDLAYAALWTWIAERGSGGSASGATIAVLEASRGRSAWWSLLAEWALADGKGPSIRAAARDDLERAEATFYESARDGRVDTLRTLAASPWIELFEVQIAHERARPWRRGPVPSDARWPWDAPAARR